MNEFNVLSHAIADIPDGLSKMISSPFWSVIGAAICTVLAFFFGHEYIAYAFAGLLTLDAITGWLKARKNGSRPDSGTLGQKTLTKLVVYLIPLFGWVLLEVIMETTGIIGAGTMNPIHITIIGWISAREMLSILENVDAVAGDTYPFIRLLYNKVKGIEKSFAENLGPKEPEIKPTTEENTDI